MGCRKALTRHMRERHSVFCLPDMDTCYSAEKEFVTVIEAKEL